VGGERNAATLAELTASPSYQPIFERVHAILDSRDRIAFPSIMGDRLYNFWQDAQNPRGVWRRTTWESYLSGSPQWEVVLDVDALARDRGGALELRRRLLPGARVPPLPRALSRGGADAVEVREFDMQTRRFIEGGFRLPEAKQSVAWVDRDAPPRRHRLRAGSMTTSGYARRRSSGARHPALLRADALRGEVSDVAWRRHVAYGGPDDELRHPPPQLLPGGDPRAGGRAPGADGAPAGRQPGAGPRPAGGVPPLAVGGRRPHYPAGR
jgi:prolyl oligopeptidase